MEELSGSIFLPFNNLNDLNNSNNAKEYLIDELKTRFNAPAPDETFGDLLYYKNISRDTAKKVLWSKYSATGGTLIDYKSINDAAKKLRDFGKLLWVPYTYQLHRRTALIQEQLPYIKTKPRQFPFKIPATPVAMYSLLSKDSLIAFCNPVGYLPCTGLELLEDHNNPPSRAYLKLQEALVMANSFFGLRLPGNGSKVFDAGAAPGGWTWVLTQLGCKVFAVDRAALDPNLMKSHLVTYKTHDAFTLDPYAVGKCDLVTSDVICYPNRLLEFVKMWINSNLTDAIIATIKLQDFGNQNNKYDIIEKFIAISGGHVLHLNYNKHELTFIWVNKSQHE